MACDENDSVLLVDADRVLALGADVGAPLALHAVEGEQVGGGGRAALDFVEVHHLQAVARARVVCLPLCRTHRSTQCQAPDAAHAVDADFPIPAQIRRPPPARHSMTLIW